MVTSASELENPAPKPAIVPTERNRFFWEGARHGRLLIARCGDCGLYLHPPMPICSRCHSSHIAPAEVSGRGIVYTYTIVRRTFHPGFAAEVPYVVAMIDLVEQEGLRLISNLVDCPHEQLAVGLAVKVRYQPHGAWMLPVFSLSSNATAETAR
ncbi:MAG: hypothetical protein JWR16_1552 [Nevskia sp.]|nr:hypothetical protein [Nevskia sp.]